MRPNRTVRIRALHRGTTALALAVMALLLVSIVPLPAAHASLPSRRPLAAPTTPPQPRSSSGWTNITSKYSSHPTSRAYGDMVYDQASGYYVLFGGENGAAVDGDTWNFTVAHGWDELSTSSSVTARADAAIAYDSTSSEVIMYGGCEGLTGCPASDTWAFSGGSWTQISKGISPTGTLSSTLSDDPAAGGVLMFGGCSSFAVLSSTCNTYIDTTYLFTASAGWSSVSSTKSPSDRSSSLMAYDPVGGYVLLFGGYDGSATYGDTWTFKGGQWTNITSTLSQSPDPRSSGVMFWDASAQEIILYGGGGSSSDYGDTWAFSSGQWTEIASGGGPAARDGAMWGAPTTAAGVPVVFGGELYGGNTYLSDEWEFVPPLVAAASRTPASVDVGQSVYFNALASGGQGPYTYAWNFGDGNTSTVENTTTTYPTASATPYVTTLTVTDNAGASVTKNFDVNVSALPKVAAAASPADSVQGTNVSFWANTTGGLGNLSYLWTFGDTTNSTAQDPTHIYPGAGGYTAKVVVTDQTGATSSATVNVTVKAPPGALSATFTSSVKQGPVPLAVTFSSNVTGGTGPYSYQWDFGDGSPGSAAPDPSHTFNTSATFLVVLNVSDTASHKVSYRASIVVTATAMTVSATATPTSGLSPLTVSFLGTAKGGISPYAYLWTFQGGATSALSAPTYTFNSSGVYNVSLKVADAPSDGQSKTTYVLINVTATTPLSASIIPPTGCVLVDSPITFQANATGSYPPFTYIWNFGDGTPALRTSQSSTVHFFNITGTNATTVSYTVNLTVQDAHNATAYAPQFTVNVAEPSACTVGTKTVPSASPLSTTQWALLLVPLAVLGGLTVLIVFRRDSEEPPVPPGYLE